MTISPELPAHLKGASAQHDRKLATGIIPLELGLSADEARMALIYDVAVMISEAVTGPGIHVMELAEMIVETVQEEG
ncbi:MAG: hypothetical protein K5872_15980 [Rhizobiaceae bacterium]|nr:hypothetical protein [Rhizobiaceae bacterium]MCV0407722.1 hypothetical protein [Rhizobiaceae bacterium]